MKNIGNLFVRLFVVSLFRYIPLLSTIVSLFGPVFLRLRLRLRLRANRFGGSGSGSGSDQNVSAPAAPAPAPAPHPCFQHFTGKSRHDSTGCFRKNDFFFKLALMTLFYVRMYINSTKSESPHYDI